MKFELKPNNRKFTNQELIKDLQLVAKNLNSKVITRKEYDEHGRFSSQTLANRFESWAKALQDSGLSSNQNYDVTNNDLIKELQRIANFPEVKTLTRNIFNKYKKISNTRTIELRFGSWSKALKEAGLSKYISQHRYSNDELLGNILEVWTYYKKQPTSKEVSDFTKIASSTYERRFGNWRKTLEAFVEYANQGESEAIIDDDKKEIAVKSQSNIIRHKTSRTINLRLRFVTFQSDNFKCRNCGRSPATDPAVILHVDHIYPWSKGGETVSENLQTLCSDCNYGKSNLC